MFKNQEQRHEAYDVALSLINSQDFYKEYTAKAPNLSAYGRREEILRARARGVYSFATEADEREQIRRYIDAYWNLPEAKKSATSSRDHMSTFELDPSVPFEAALAAYQAGNGSAYAAKVLQDSAPHVPKMDGSNRPASPIPTQTQKEITMTAIIKIETKTFANGVDIATMSDSAVYDLIAAQEAKIKELEGISAKPKKLVKEIADRKAGIQALVDYLDSKA